MKGDNYVRLAKTALSPRSPAAGTPRKRFCIYIKLSMDLDAKLVSPGHIHPGHHYRRNFLCIGASELLFGILCIVLEVANIAMYSKDSSYMHDPISPGIWCGIWFLLAGILAVLSARRPDHYNVIGGMIVALFAAIGSVGLLCYKVITATLSAGETPSNVLAIHITIVLLAFGQSLASVLHVIVTAKATTV